MGSQSAIKVGGAQRGFADVWRRKRKKRKNGEEEREGGGSIGGHKVRQRDEEMLMEYGARDKRTVSL